MRRRRFLGGLAALPLAGCGKTTFSASGGDSAPATTVALLQGAELPTLTRLASSGSGDLFEAELTAAPHSVEFRRGVRTFVWAYNASVPGPLLELREGQRVRIAFGNQLSLQPSNLHWHGLPVPPDQDGSPYNPIEPFRRIVYDWVVPYGSAGTYWYHPHPHEVTHEQVFRGMAGMIVVRGDDDPIPAEFEEKHLFLTDLKLDADGQIPPNTQVDDVDGREGNHLMVNGVEHPFVRIRSGTRQRWRIVNATSARFLRLALTGHTLTQVGSDGGLLEAPVERSEIFLGPAERADVVVSGTGAPGSEARLLALPYDRHRRGVATGPSAQIEVLRLTYSGEAPTTAPEVPAFLRSIPRLGTPVLTRRVTFGGSFDIDGREFQMNRIDALTRAGQVEEWEVVNDAAADHPFHIHGGQFQLLERSSQGTTVAEPLAWRDTFNLLPGERARFRMVQEQPGLRVYHCHILEHEDHGMMATQEVV